MGLEDFKKVVIGNCTLYLGDCLEVLHLLDKVDALITDPPYGVGDGVGSKLKKNPKKKTNYSTYIDTEENFHKTILPAVIISLSISQRAAITSGFKQMYEYPKPKHVGSFQYSGTTVMSPWGPALWQPILYYGKDPYPQTLTPDSFQNCNDVDRETNHPCPKPLASWTKLVKRASLNDETILDPFMGSGTTGVACVKLGRKFIGIELDEDYFNIACERIRNAYAQPDLFIEQPKQLKQERLFEK